MVKVVESRLELSNGRTVQTSAPGVTRGYLMCLFSDLLPLPTSHSTIPLGNVLEASLQHCARSLYFLPTTTIPAITLGTIPTQRGLHDTSNFISKLAGLRIRQDVFWIQLRMRITRQRRTLCWAGARAILPRRPARALCYPDPLVHCAVLSIWSHRPLFQRSHGPRKLLYREMETVVQFDAKAHTP